MISTECPACGHLKGREMQDGEVVEINEEADDFITIEGSFHVNKSRRFRGGRKEEVTLLACSNCNNILLKERI